ncbi:MAG: PsbP-related protein [Patescibacteria group bacterium]
MDNQTAEPTNPPAQTVPPVQPASSVTPPSSKSFLSGKLIILIVIFLIIFAGGGTYLALNFKSEPTPPFVGGSPIKSPESDPTATWKTYTNTTYGFSFKYPKAWYTQEVPGWSTPGASISFYQNGATPTENYADTPTNTLLNVQLSKNTQTNEQFRNTAPQAYGYQKTLTIGGAPAFQIQAKTNTRQYYIKYSTANLMILTAYTSEAVTALDVIVSSIKFTDASQAADTPTWKTYTNAKGKYSLQYPPTSTFTEDANGNATGNLSNNKVVIATEPTVLSLSNYIDQKTWCLSISSTTGKAFNLNSDNSLRFDKTPCGSTGSTDIYSVHNGIAYHIFIETQENFDKVQPIFDQILSTFKFTDASQTTDASTWKTYTSPNKIFTLKYPLSLNVTQKYISNLPSGWLDEGVLSTTQPWNDSFTKNSDYRINFSQVPKSSGESLENFVSRFIKERGGSFLIPDSKKTIRVDGKESIWYVGNLGPATKHIEVYIPKTNTEVLIVELWDNNQPPSVDHQNILDQILSTFKFTQ